MTATVTATREFTSSNLHAFRVDSLVDAPTDVAADGTVRVYSILGVEHNAYATLVGWYRTPQGWVDEVLETWTTDISDAEALATAEYLSTPLTIAA